MGKKKALSLKILWQIRFYRHVNQNFRRKHPILLIKRTTSTRFARVIYLGFWVSHRYFCQWQDWNSSKITLCGESSRLREVKQFSCDVFFFHTQSWRTLSSFGHYCVPMHTNLFKILCFSCRRKSRDIVYQRICLFLWLIFAQHGLFEIQLTVYSALSRLTDLGIYDITRCGIWLLTIFHIPYIHFQPELRKITSPKWYLSFLFSIVTHRIFYQWL